MPPQGMSSSAKYYREHREEINAKRKVLRDANPEKYREQSSRYREKHRDKVLAQDKLYREKNKAAIAEIQKKWWAKNPDYRDKNKEKIAESRRKSREKHREATAKRRRDKMSDPVEREKYNKRFRRLRKTNPNYKIGANLRTRMSALIREGAAKRSAVKLLGCSLNDLRRHLEKLFADGMTWDNYGKGGWHIDHIVPLSVLDLTDPCELARACHYTNLQPLWEKDNLRKHNRG